MKIIDKIEQEATDNNWPYPKKFEAFKEAGIQLYRVDLGESFRVAYEKKSGVIEKTELECYVPLKIAKTFSGEGVQQAIYNHMGGKTSYVQFLADIANAGVTHYTVEMNSRAIFYYNFDESKFHRENVPLWHGQNDRLK